MKENIKDLLSVCIEMIESHKEIESLAILFN